MSLGLQTNNALLGPIALISSESGLDEDGVPYSSTAAISLIDLDLIGIIWRVNKSKQEKEETHFGVILW